MENLKNQLFDIDIPGPSPFRGCYLVAEPFLKESYFRHAVICLSDYEEGKEAMGLVMNRLTNLSLQELIEDVTAKKPVPIFCGGPMSGDRLFYMHTLGDIITDSQRVSDGLWIGGDFNEIIQYVNAGYQIDGDIRFFLGYSGWSPQQLEQEIRDRVWAVAPSPLPSKVLTDDNDAYWHRFVRHLGPAYRGWRFHPHNPHVN